MKTKFSKFLLAMFIALPSLLFSQNYPLQVILTPSSNFTSYFGELKENPGRYMQVRVINNSGASRNVYFQMRIERLYPSTDISVYSNIEKKPDLPIPIAIGSNSMRMDQLDDNFATHQYEDFAVSGIEVNSVDDLMGSFRIPEGQYKLCLIAYDYDTPIGSEPVMLSDPNFSCAQVKICYSASKIELISPVNTMIAGNSSNVVIQPKRNLLVQWTQPTTTCGASMGNVDYELKFTDIYDGQTEEDALNYNPILLSLSYKNKTSVMLDTMQYQGIFNNGKRYAIGVTATASNQDIAILNDGKTTPASFIYGELPPNKGQQNTVKSKPSITNVPDCGNAVPDNKELIATLNINDTIHVGNYDMKLTNVSKNGDRFDGTGTINLIRNSLFSGSPQITAKVKFDKLQVNTANQVIDGIVRTVYDDVEKQKVFGEFGNDPNWASNNLTSDRVDSEVLKSNVKQFIKNFLKPNASQMQANVSFPIKVPTSNNNSDNGINILITSMSFGAKGASVNMLSFMEIPETETMLAFGAQNVCINNDNISDAKIYLFKNIKTTIEGLDFAIVGGEDKTYVKWNNKGYQGIKLSAKISIPNSVIIDKEGKNIDNLELGAEFNSWSNWEAKITIPDFKLAFCQDLSFDGLEARYVHKIGADGTVNKGIIFPNLKMNLPDYIKGLDGIIVESASILSGGFNLSLEKTGILPINSGRIGGWGFSIDELKFNIVDNIFKTGKIAGKIKIPFFENEIAYGGSPTASLNNMLDLKISVNIENNFSTKFLHYFNAEIAKTSKINIGNDGKIEAVLDGGVKVAENSGCDFGFSATFSGFTIGTNYNDAEPKLDLKIGNWGTSETSNNTWNGFGFQIKEFAFKDTTKGENIELEFSVSADLQLGEGKFKIAGACKPIFKFDINKKTKEVSNPSFTFDSVMVAGEFSAVKLYGYLTMFDNDEKWGKGIRGDIDCTFPLKLQVKSKVCFGKTIKNEKNKKYFFADAAFKLPPELGINTGAINIYGFGGAFWWNLEVSGKNFTATPVSDENPVSHLKTMGQSEATVATSSGIDLVPYTGDGSAFGFAADVYFCSSAGGPYMYNGQVGLGLSIKNGTFDKLNLNGKIRVIGTGEDNDDGYVSTGNVSITIGKELFDAEASLNVNILGAAQAIVPLRIIADFGNNNFGFHLGEPFYRNGKCGDKEGKTWIICGGFEFPMIQAEISLQGYFVAGNKISYDMPALPPELVSLLGSEVSRRSSQKVGTKRLSPGIMFGTRFRFDFAFNFGPIEASLTSILGFDIEMKQCQGQQCANGDYINGINGYYCRGQLYGYLKGAIGVVIKFFGKTRRFDLCSLEAGALLRGGFPAPSWFKGAVAIKGEILGGLISFNTSTRFSVGKECKDPNGSIDVTIIDEITPGFRSREAARNQPKKEKASIYTTCAVSTFVPMNEPVRLLDLTDEESTKEEIYKFKFREALLYDISDGQSKSIRLNEKRYNEMIGDGAITGKKFVVKPAMVLKPNAMHRLVIVSQVLQMNAQGDYVIPKDIKEEASFVRDTVYFETGDIPDGIPEEIIAIGYPSKRQVETFRDVNDNDKSGYLILENEVGYLFDEKHRDISLGERGLLGVYRNLSRKEEKPILFLYTYSTEKHPKYNGVAMIKYPLRGYVEEKNMTRLLTNGDIYDMQLYVVESTAKMVDYAKVKVDTLIADEISESSGGSVDTTVMKEIKDSFIIPYEPDKNLGGAKISEGKHTGKIYEAIRGKQDAVTNPVDGFRTGIIKGSEITNQGNIANRGSQISNQGSIAGGLNQGSVSGAVGLGNQLVGLPAQGTTTKSMPKPGVPTSNSSVGFSTNTMQSNANHIGNISDPAGAIITYKGAHSNNISFVSDNADRSNSHRMELEDIGTDRNIIQYIAGESVNYENYKNIQSNTRIKEFAFGSKTKKLASSSSVGNTLISSKFVSAVEGKKEESKIQNLEEIYKTAKLKSIFSNQFRVSYYSSLAEKVKTVELKAFDTPSHPLPFFPADYPVTTSFDDNCYPMKVELWDMNKRFIEVTLPPYTTTEEVFGGSAFDNSDGYERPPNYQFSQEVFHFQEGSMGYEWKLAFLPFMNAVRKACTDFTLPYTKEDHLYEYTLLRHTNAKYLNKGYSSTAHLQGRLSDDEVKTGSTVYRDYSVGSGPRLVYWYHQPEMMALHFAYAMGVGYYMAVGQHLYEKEIIKYEERSKWLIFSDYDSVGTMHNVISVIDNMADIDTYRHGAITFRRDKLWLLDNYSQLQDLRDWTDATYHLGGNYRLIKPYPYVHRITDPYSLYAHFDHKDRRYYGMGGFHWFPNKHECIMYYIDGLYPKPIPTQKFEVNFNVRQGRGKLPDGKDKSYVKTSKK